MISLQGLLILLKLPIELFVVLVKYYTVGHPLRRFNNSLFHSLKLIVCRTALSLSIPDSHFISFYSNSFLIKYVVGTFSKSITSQLPGYGTRYDKNSFWLVKQPNRKPDDPIMIYIHGGGYFLQTQPEQIESTLAIYKLVSPEKQKRLSILFLDYDLARAGQKLPHQMTQLHETYLNLTTIEGNTNVILMGDSAGGNLSLGYLQFLKKTNLQNIIYPTKLVLVSPWCIILHGFEKLKPDHSLYTTFDYDVIRHSTLSLDKPACIVENLDDIKTLQFSPGLPPTKQENWDSIPTLKDPKYDVFVVAGEDECLRSEILDWCHYALEIDTSKHQYGTSNNSDDLEGYEFIRKGGPNRCHARLYVEPWGIHDSAFFFENHLLLKIKKNLKNPTKRPLDIKDVNRKEFYGISRIVEFLNDTL